MTESMTASSRRFPTLVPAPRSCSASCAKIRAPIRRSPAAIPTFDGNPDNSAATNRLSEVRPVRTRTKSTRWGGDGRHLRQRRGTEGRGRKKKAETSIAGNSIRHPRTITRIAFATKKNRQTRVTPRVCRQGDVRRKFAVRSSQFAGFFLRTAICELRTPRNADPPLDHPGAAAPRLSAERPPRQAPGQRVRLHRRSADVLSRRGRRNRGRFQYHQQYPNGQRYVDVVYNWISSGGVGADLAFQLDPLSIVMLLVVTWVGFLIHLYSVGYMAHEEGYWRYFSYLNLFLAEMLVLVLGSSYLVMFVGWEGVGLCSYLLIGFYYDKDFAAAGGQEGVHRQSHRRLRFPGRHVPDVRVLRLCRFRQGVADGCRLAPNRGSSPRSVSCCSSARRESRRRFRCTSGCRTRWPARRRCPR